jgi:CBS domain-containing protein
VGNSDRFLGSFRAIEGELRRRAGGDRGLTFAELLRQGEDGVVRRYRLDLREFAELRNAIVHAADDTLLAEPTDAAVERIEHIRSLMEAPPRLDTVLGRRKVATTEPEARIRDAVLTMHRNGFSQLPVYDDGACVGLLTAGGVAAWVARMLEVNDGLLEEASVGEVLAYEEDPDTCAFLPPSATVFDAMDLFLSHARRGHHLHAILITDGGRRDGRPLNIVTVDDVPRMAEAL